MMFSHVLLLTRLIVLVHVKVLTRIMALTGYHAKYDILLRF